MRFKLQNLLGFLTRAQKAREAQKERWAALREKTQAQRAKWKMSTPQAPKLPPDKFSHVPNAEAFPWCHHFRPGTMALREICQYQGITELLITNYLIRDLSRKLSKSLYWTYISKGLSWVSCRKLQRHILWVYLKTQICVPFMWRGWWSYLKICSWPGEFTVMSLGANLNLVLLIRDPLKAAFYTQLPPINVHVHSHYQIL